MKLFIQYIFIILICSSVVSAQTDSTNVRIFANDSTNVKIDSAAFKATDSLKTKVIQDTIKPVFIEAYDAYTLSTKKAIDRSDYRYTGNLFTYLPFGRLDDLGQYLQPSQVSLYNLGFNAISYLDNGININNRINNSFDLNNYQSESIDSMEVISLPKGFLFSSVNNPVSVNFISRNKLSGKPHSRIRFIQAPNDEGFADFQFNAFLSPKFRTFFEITNGTAESNFANSDGSLWQGSIRFQYILSGNTDLFADYSYLKSNVHLNGGVVYRTSIDSIYDSFLAPVRFTNRYQKTSLQNAGLRLLHRFSDRIISDVSLYYQDNLSEYRVNDPTGTNFQDGLSPVMQDNKYHLFGVQAKQDIGLSIFNLRLIGNIERAKHESNLSPGSIDVNTYSASAEGSAFFFNILKGTAFTKYLKYRGNDYVGIGAEGELFLSKKTSLYFGLSRFQKPELILSDYFSPVTFDTYKRKLTLAEARLKVLFGKSDLSIGYFHYNNSLNGMNANINLKIWKILLSSNNSIYSSRFVSAGGIYYEDILFNENLNLKTGFNYRFYSELSLSFVTTVPTSPAYSAFPFYPYIKNSFQIDFFLSGRIQDAATIYFTWENLLGEDYFIVPIYPMYQTGLRFGVAWDFLD
ncbi:MAG: putative porin [Melioribacteraceae bacterium]|nr:putative porin [Melioribacteraceae bacterium]